MKIVSKAQAGFLGAVASGKSTRKGGPSAEKARRMLRENRGRKFSRLPKRAAKR